MRRRSASPATCICCAKPVNEEKMRVQASWVRSAAAWRWLRQRDVLGDAFPSWALRRAVAGALIELAKLAKPDVIERQRLGATAELGALAAQLRDRRCQWREKETLIKKLDAAWPPVTVGDADGDAVADVESSGDAAGGAEADVGPASADM